MYIRLVTNACTRIVAVKWTPYTSRLTHLKKTFIGNADGCNFFIEYKIRCEEHTKHPYRVRDLNVRLTSCSQKKRLATLYLVPAHIFRALIIGWHLLTDCDNALFQSIDGRNCVADITVHVYLVGWGLTTLLTQIRSYRGCHSWLSSANSLRRPTASRQTLRRRQLARPLIKYLLTDLRLSPVEQSTALE